MEVRTKSSSCSGMRFLLTVKQLHIVLNPCWIATYALSVAAYDCRLLYRRLDPGVGGCDRQSCSGARDSTEQIGKAGMDHGKRPASEYRSGAAAVARRLSLGWH